MQHEVLEGEGEAVSAGIAKGMKLIRLRALIEELFGPRRERLWGTVAFGHAEKLNTQLGTVMKFLRHVEPTDRYPETRWPPIWLPVPRESIAELQSLYPDDSEADLREYVEAECPETVGWFAGRVSRDRDEVRLSLYPEDALLIFDSARSRFGVPQVRGTKPDRRLLLEYGGWFLESLTVELRRFAGDPAVYNAWLDRELPLSERFGKFRLRDLWEVAPDVPEPFRINLSEAERRDLVRLAGSFTKAAPLRELALSDYLRFCSICYRGAGYGLHNLSPPEQYRSKADGRDEGLLAIDPASPRALAQWMDTRHGSGHPWEIARGGNFTHISLYLQKDDDGYRLTLEGSALTRAAETIRMALALAAEGVPFRLADVDLHVRRVQGLDWIGIVPRYYLGAHDYSDLFPGGEPVHDAVDHTLLDEYPALREHVIWYPPQQL